MCIRTWKRRECGAGRGKVGGACLQLLLFVPLLLRLPTKFNWIEINYDLSETVLIITAKLVAAMLLLLLCYTRIETVSAREREGHGDFLSSTIS